MRSVQRIFMPSLRHSIASIPSVVSYHAPFCLSHDPTDMYAPSLPEPETKIHNALLKFMQCSPFRTTEMFWRTDSSHSHRFSTRAIRRKPLSSSRPASSSGRSDWSELAASDTQSHRSAEWEYQLDADPDMNFAAAAADVMSAD
jgi:hypothetical protein